MTKDSHHHGNLRAALITAALELLEEDGIAGLTLRRAAARAGVSHAAPAHHFDGLPGLLTATATRAFELFTASMVAAREAAAPDAMAQLQGVGAGYIAFARAHSGLFHLMFATPALCQTDPDLLAASAASYEVLRQACAPFASAPPEKLELAVWSLVHGYATLTQSHAPAGPARSIPAFADLLALLVKNSSIAGRDLPLAPPPAFG